MKLSVQLQRFLLILFCFVVSSSEIFSAVIPESQAGNIAADFVFWKGGGSRAGSASVELAHVVKSAGADRIYIYNVAGGGWVMVSANDNTRRNVLGYSPTGRFDYSALPVNARGWIENYAGVIAQLDSHPEYVSRDSVMQSRAAGAVAPLLGEVAWGQGEPYNLLCPTLNSEVRAVTGCVATAMAQIMMYHRYPAAGQGGALYEWNGQTLTTQFGKYDWDQMLPKYTGNESEASRQAVATLMRDCGYSVSMDYGLESGAYVTDITGALMRNFVYDCSMIYLPHSDCDTESWEGILMKELDEKRPVLYSGTGKGGGHAFVCDGYDDKGYFHFNWGWNGASDGYFLTGEHSFPFDQAIIYGIQPDCGGNLKGYFVIERLRTGENNLSFSGSFSYSYSGNTTIELGYGIENVETGEKHTHSLNEFGEVDGRQMEKRFIPDVSGLQDGNYIVYPLMRCEGETEWSDCFYKESEFSSGKKKNWEVEVKDGECFFQTISRTVDGITYGAEYVNAGVYSVDVIDIDSDIENLIIPSSVNIADETYRVHRIQIKDKEKLVSIKTDATYLWITGCTNLKTLTCNGPYLNGNCDSPVLENIELTENFCSYGFDILHKEECPLKKLKFPIKRQGLYIEGQCLSNMGAIDIYLYSDIPPVFRNRELCKNTDITFHIPAGTMDIYTNAGFGNIGTLVEDITGSTYSLEWGLNGGIYDELAITGTASGIGVGAGSNNVEYAVKLNKSLAETYKGNKITAITYYTSVDNEVGYVFLSKDDKGYITRQNVYSQPGSVTTVYFDEPYTITGEPIYFGIGNKHELGITWATTDLEVPDNMYIRLVGDDYGNCRIKPGKWEYRGGRLFNPDGFFKSLAYPLPISITIEGQNIPVDASILGIKVEGIDSKPSSENTVDMDTNNEYARSIGDNDNGVYRYYRTADGVRKLDFADAATAVSEVPVTMNDSRAEKDPTPEVKLFNDSCKVMVLVQNRSEKKINSLKLRTVAGGREIDTEYPHPLAVNQTALIPVSFPIKEMDDEFTVNTSVAEVDGTVDNIPDDGITTAKIMNYSRSETYPLIALVEKVTTAMEYDRYESGLKEIEKEWPDNYIGIDIHYDDEMANPENYDCPGWTVNGFPYIKVNRRWENRSIIEGGHYGVEISPYFKKNVNKATESVKITKAVTNGEECEVTAVVSAAYPISGNSFALAFVVLEDKVGPYPKQCNTGMDENGQWIFETRNELFDDVARGIYGEFNGVTGLLPDKMGTNASYPVTYSFTMPKNIQNLDNTKIVALLLLDDNILNSDDEPTIASADRMKLEVDRSMSGVDEVTEDGDDIIKVDGNRIYTVVKCDRLEVFAIDGKSVGCENLTRGFYVARAFVNGRVYVKKIVI